MSDKFSKDHDVLSELGLHPRLVQAYGKIEFMAGAKGECWPTMAAIAKRCGLKSVRQARRVVAELVAFRLITVKAGKYHAPNRYRKLEPDLEWIRALLGDRTRMSGLGGRGCPVLDRTRMSDRKESSSRKEKNKGKENPFPPNPPFPTAEANAPRAKTTAANAKANANANANPSKGFDDDDPNQTPEQRFAARLLRRHGATFDSDTCIANVRRQLEKCTGVTLADFLSFDRQKTTGNGNSFRNPMGYYTDIAKQFARRAMREARDAMVQVPEQPAPDIPRDDKGRCAKCGGGGMLADRSYCDCPMGRDLSRVAKRKPKSETGKRADYTVM